ncbi:MAG: PKD domain-containing protein [Bacteroidota bacterium]
MKKTTLILLLTVSILSCVKPATARFELSATDYVVGEDISYFNTSTNAKSQHWNFGDGQFSEEYSPVHKYAKAGTYRVVLTLNGGSSEMSTDITILSEYK